MHGRHAAIALCVTVGAIVLASCAKQEARPATSGAGSTPAAKEFVELLATGDFTGATKGFDARMKQGMPPQKLEEAWHSLLAQAGAFKQQVGVRTTKEQGFDCAYVTCEFERDTVDVKVVFDRGGKISGLWFVPPK